LWRVRVFVACAGFSWRVPVCFVACAGNFWVYPKVTGLECANVS
jgi:hypothetical protein